MLYSSYKVLRVTQLRRLGPKGTSVRAQDRQGLYRPKGQTTRNNRRHHKGTNDYTGGESGYSFIGYGDREGGYTRRGGEKGRIGNKEGSLGRSWSRRRVGGKGQVYKAISGIINY